jgi:hypothetical protein
MFRPLEPLSGSATVTLDGKPVLLPAGTNLAAALLTAGYGPFRTTPVGDTPREPYCMMGVCFDCLAVIDGIPNRQTCLEQVRDGMVIQRQCGAAETAA